MKWFVLVVAILLIPVLMITCKKPDITGTWVDYRGIEERALKAGSGMTFLNDGAILETYHTTNGIESRMNGQFRFEEGWLKVIEEEKYLIDGDGVRTDFAPDSWAAEIEFIDPNEIVIKHPARGDIRFRR